MKMAGRGAVLTSVMIFRLVKLLALVEGTEQTIFLPMNGVSLLQLLKQARFSESTTGFSRNVCHSLQQLDLSYPSTNLQTSVPAQQFPLSNRITHPRCNLHVIMKPLVMHQAAEGGERACNTHRRRNAECSNSNFTIKHMIH